MNRHGRTDGPRPPARAAPEDAAKHPQRTTKAQPKLVMFPDADPGSPGRARTAATANAAFAAPQFAAALADGTLGDASDLARLRLEEREALPRVTAYCVAEGYRMEPLLQYLRRRHLVTPRVYDEVMHASYSERQKARAISHREGLSFVPSLISGLWAGEGAPLDDGSGASVDTSPLLTATPLDHEPFADEDASEALFEARRMAEPWAFADIFVFDYGVLVFWNWTEAEELVVLHRLQRFCVRPLPPDAVEIENLHCTLTTPEPAARGGALQRRKRKERKERGLGRAATLWNAAPAAAAAAARRAPAVAPSPFTAAAQLHPGRRGGGAPDEGSEKRRRLDAAAPAAAEAAPDAAEEAVGAGAAPDGAAAAPAAAGSRIVNDIIHLASASAMIKLTVSHGIGQSVKLTFYENEMEATIDNTKHLPQRLATLGNVKLSRRQITRTMGELYKLRMGVNLVSNVLDTPEWFWSERDWKALYDSVRAYLEIPQRVELLNGRTKVLSDLLDMLSDHLHSAAAIWSTWIIIILIVVAIVVALAEIAVKALRFTKHAGASHVSDSTLGYHPSVQLFRFGVRSVAQLLG